MNHNAAKQNSRIDRGDGLGNSGAGTRKGTQQGKQALSGDDDAVIGNIRHQPSELETAANSRSRVDLRRIDSAKGRTINAAGPSPGARAPLTTLNHEDKWGEEKRPKQMRQAIG